MNNIRVDVIYGKKPIILVAPHGSDDMHTALITETVAKKLDANAVINYGFERGETPDPDNDIADCNRIDHCQSPIVYEEFLKPLIKIKSIIDSTFRMKEEQTLVLFIHGCGDIVHKETGENVGVIVGYGLGGKKDSITCRNWRKNAFVEFWRRNCKGHEVYEGSGSGRYAGRSSNNMNQYFKRYENISADSLQLEFPLSFRSHPHLASNLIAITIEDMWSYIKFNGNPITKLI